MARGELGFRRLLLAYERFLLAWRDGLERAHAAAHPMRVTKHVYDVDHDTIALRDRNGFLASWVQIRYSDEGDRQPRFEVRA